MKQFILILTLALPLSGLTAVAADQPATQEGKRAKARDHLQQVVDQLELTDDQRAAIAPIMQQQMIDLKALRDDSSLRRLQRARKAKAINETASAQIRALLTPDQQTKYDALRAEMKDEMKARAKERKAEKDADN